MNLPEKVYTETDLKDARTKGKAIGWLQGGGIVLSGTLLWKFLSWVPVVLGGGLVIWLLYKLFSRKSSKDGADGLEQEDHGG